MGSALSTQGVSLPYNYSQPYQRPVNPYPLASSLGQRPVIPAAMHPMTPPGGVSGSLPLWQRVKRAWSSEKTLSKVNLGLSVIWIINSPFLLVNDIRKGYQEFRKQPDTNNLRGNLFKDLNWYKLLERPMFRFDTMLTFGLACLSIVDIARFVKKIQAKKSSIAPISQNQSVFSNSQRT
jgi:hypothetical protein